MNAEYEKFVGGNIRKLREERRLTQEQLSAKLQILGCDITRSALAKIEVGQRHLYPDELYFLKQILAVHMNSFWRALHPAAEPLRKCTLLPLISPHCAKKQKSRNRMRF